jgi:signal transduction histidine kinase
MNEVAQDAYDPSMAATQPPILVVDDDAKIVRLVRTYLEREGGGAGIGLAIVRQLVRSFGGRVGVESGNGLTRFWFGLPAATTGKTAK